MPRDLPHQRQADKSRRQPANSEALFAIDGIRALGEQLVSDTATGNRLCGFGSGVHRLDNEMQRVYRLLRLAREQGDIPWEWIVDETRQVERVATCDNPAAYARAVARSYRRDFWNQQPVRVEVWSEKGTVRGVLAPVLDEYAVGFNVLHGFSSATAVYDSAQSDSGQPLIVLYVGDWDPSGLCMSERDLPERLARYGGDHIELRRIALAEDQLVGLPSFPASDKKKDKRYGWFVKNFGHRCWELDALDPNDLRDCVESAITELIEPTAWDRCEAINRAEQEWLRTILKQWRPAQ